MEELEKNIRLKVIKHKSGKPFKSGLKINTVKGVINHPILNIPAYVFEEDDSYVECRRCKFIADLTADDITCLTEMAMRSGIPIITAEQKQD